MHCRNIHRNFCKVSIGNFEHGGQCRLCGSDHFGYASIGRFEVRVSSITLDSRPERLIEI